MSQIIFIFGNNFKVMEKIKLILASGNAHKFEEIAHIIEKNSLDSYFELTNLKQLNFEGDIPENQDTLEGNAYQKSKFIHDMFGDNCFADDTGLEVEALDGAPGVYSARYAGENGNATKNKQKLLQTMIGEQNRNAQFRTVISLILEEKEYQFEGIVKGSILDSERGAEGFGYDPLFVPEGYDQSFAEMDLDEKNKISHRARAMQKMIAFLKDYVQRKPLQ